MQRAVKTLGFEDGTTIALNIGEKFYYSVLFWKAMMISLKLRFALLAIAVLGLTSFAAPSAVQAQCGYTTGYSTYYAPSYGYSYTPSYGHINYYAPSYGYSSQYYTPYYGYNQNYYGGYYDARRERARRLLTLAVVAGVVIAASDSDNRNRNNYRYRSSRNRNRH